MKKKNGRPTIYNEKMALEICKRLMSGETLLQICRDDHMPSRITVYAWLLDEKHLKFSNMYTHARAIQAEHMFDELIEISDDGSNDWMEIETKAGRKIEVVNHEHINRSRLRVDTRKWYISKVLPKKYGEKIVEDDQDSRLNDEVDFVGVPTQEGNGRFKRFLN
jgi:hypothetical protein